MSPTATSDQAVADTGSCTVSNNIDAGCDDADGKGDSDGVIVPERDELRLTVEELERDASKEVVMDTVDVGDTGGDCV